MRVTGLDISTHTGIANLVMERDGVIRMPYSGVIHSKKSGFDRCADMAMSMMDIVNGFKPDLVVIEGYGYSNAHTLVTLVEIGTVLRYFLWQEGIKYRDVSPNTLKKFATGKGNSPKDVVIKEVYKHWGHDVTDNNIADAIVLGYLGLALKGAVVGLPKSHLEALKAIS